MEKICSCDYFKSVQSEISFKYGRYSKLASNIISRLNSVAFPVIALLALSQIPGAEAGLIAGIVTLTGCVGAGLWFPGSLFWTAAPCYELTVVATANPLLP